MKAVDANLLELLKKSERFIVPIYQRVYSWGIPECDQLWTDIVRAGARQGLSNHFTGSIVYIEKGQGTTTSREPDLIIDGQQRMTTVTLVLAALAAHLDTLHEDEREPVAGFAPQKIRGQYLTNPYESGDEFFKLILSKHDKDALKAVVGNVSLPVSDSRIIGNYQFFVDQLRRADSDTVIDVCRGLAKLVVVDVKLTRGVDDPQLVFESMNATGKKLSEADLIRNFVLMDLPPAKQERLYEDYWFPMEKLFQGVNEPRFDEFVRHFLTVKTLSIPRVDEIYDAFKEYAADEEKNGLTRDELVVDLSRNAAWFAKMALDTETEQSLAKRFRELDQLATVAYPFQLRLYADYTDGKLTSVEFEQILDTTISYLFRRAVCRIPTNSLNKTFATLAAAIDSEDHVGSVCGRLLTLPDYRRFPSDEEFKESLASTDLYHLKRRVYFFRAMENHGRKEEVSTAEYTIEHIMPQNANHAWREALGPDWETTHDRYLHTLGNLTLTGYNPEYSDRPFHEKRDMEGGFRDSPLRLNRGLGKLDRWDGKSIEQRAERLAEQALNIWPRPTLSVSELQRYRQKFGDSRRFDWSLTHSILAALPAGRWTSYNALAEAVGTGAQAIARHLSTCGTCENAYRVLTWDGRVANDFRWTDGDDRRDPADVLRSENVNLSDGRADVEQQLATEDLLELVGESER
ncbi:MAG: DUF262 domain-containing protein [Dermabacter sp.]|nr:DUF262 domain-containing protein [Dermabacter sp.]